MKYGQAQPLSSVLDMNSTSQHSFSSGSSNLPENSSKANVMSSYAMFNIQSSKENINGVDKVLGNNSQAIYSQSRSLKSTKNIPASTMSGIVQTDNIGVQGLRRRQPIPDSNYNLQSQQVLQQRPVSVNRNDTMLRNAQKVEASVAQVLSVLNYMVC
jgi:hypothetical protein